MTTYRHQVLLAAPRGAADLARGILKADFGAGRLFGVFTSQIGLSANHVVAISAFPGEAAARAADVPAGAAVERDEVWRAGPRPADNEALPETDGVFSHRWWDIAEGDWPRFRQLSIDAWDNFEGVHDTRVIGFWRAAAPPGPGLTRVWLMAWYRNLAAWEDSRWYLNPHRPDAAQAYAAFRARGALTLDTAVSVLRRVTDKP